MARKALTKAEKEHICRRKQEGATHSQVAEELNCSPETIKKWWAYERQGKVPQPRGRPKQGALSSYSEQIRATAKQLKQSHPHWGPVTVRLKVKKELDLKEEELPSPSRLGVFFQEQCPEAVKPYQPRQYPEKPPPQVTKPHQRWQMDGKEKVQVGERGETVTTVLDVVDPYSGLFIASEAVETTTEKGWRKLTLTEIQTILRTAFSQWGLPQQIQTDREVVYVGSAERCFPSLFTLWLTGLGLEHVLSRPKRPTDQAHVERGHRTLGDLVWKDTLPLSVSALQTDLDQARLFLNQQYPSRATHCHGQPPLQAHPQAHHSGHFFHPLIETQLFDLNRVDAFLAQHVWTRLVSDTGVVSVAAQRYYLGRSFAGQTISLTFLPDPRSFRFTTAEGDEIATLPVRGLNREDILGFTVVDNWPCPEQPSQLPLPISGWV
jgi:transposase InsO family protein